MGDIKEYINKLILTLDKIGFEKQFIELSEQFPLYLKEYNDKIITPKAGSHIHFCSQLNLNMVAGA